MIQAKPGGIIKASTGTKKFQSYMAAPMVEKKAPTPPPMAKRTIRALWFLFSSGYFLASAKTGFMISRIPCFSFRAARHRLKLNRGPRSLAIFPRVIPGVNGMPRGSRVKATEFRKFADFKKNFCLLNWTGSLSHKFCQSCAPVRFPSLALHWHRENGWLRRLL